MNDSRPAPVALFIFNRPQLTAKVYERIRAAQPSQFLVVADGPRPGRSDDVKLCEATRKIVTSPDWPCELLTNFSRDNLGAGHRLASGLDWVFEQCSEAIVLEDDCIPCRSFFTFCSEMLGRYRDDSRIMHISGDNFQSGHQRGPGSYFFSKYTFSWGWATWKRAWRYYDVNLALWPIAYKERWLYSILDNSAEVTYWESIFHKVHAWQIDGWDYQWLFACWCQSGLSIQPNQNLVTNVGVGPDATHFKGGHSTLGIPTAELGECVHPNVIIRDRVADRFAFEEHIAGRQSPGGGNWLPRLKRRLALRTRIKHFIAG